MTLDELKLLIDQRIQDRLDTLFGEFEIGEISLSAEERDQRALQEVFESIDRHLWSPPPGAKSSLDLLREDRDTR
jgi:hypothetical protein